MKHLCIIAIFFLSVSTSHSQFHIQNTSPAQISSLVPAFNEVTTFNVKTVNISLSMPVVEPTPIDGDTTTDHSNVYKYGDEVTTNIVLSDGNVTTTTLGKVWTLKIVVPDALNVGCVFAAVTFSANAELYVFNTAHTTLVGDIKASYFSDISTLPIPPVKGQEVVIYLLERGNFSTLQSSFVITNVTGGYEEIYESGTSATSLLNSSDAIIAKDIQHLTAEIIKMGPSINNTNDESSVESRFVPGDCSPFINCFPTKASIARSVGMIFGIGGQASGVLLNNEANSTRPIFLTAFHVIDRNENGTIDPSEIAALRSGFVEFRFWRPNCSSDPSRGVAFAGLSLLSASRTSDVALLEIINGPGIGDDVNYAGWNRTTNEPHDKNSSIIHHPRGLDMRYTKTDFVKTYIFSNDFWQAGYDEGTVNQGSSGGPLLNQYNQVVGQVGRGWGNCTFLGMSDRYGKFSTSYNDGNLQPFLSPSQNLVEVPQLTLTNLQIDGESEIGCNTATYTYSVINLPSCSYFWNIPAEFTVVSGQNTSTISLQRANASPLTSSVNITATMFDSKGRIRVKNLSKTITLSPGSQAGFWINSYIPYPEPSCYSTDAFYFFQANSSPASSNPNFEWSYRYQGGPYVVVSTSTSYIGQFIFDRPGYYDIIVRPVTDCGLGSDVIKSIYVSSDCMSMFRGMAVKPNPVKNDLVLEFASETSAKSTPSELTIRLHEFHTGKVVATFKKAYSKSIQISTTSLKDGQYILVVEGSGEKATRQIIVKH